MSTYDPERLRALGTELAGLRRRIKVITPEIAEQIRAGGAEGVELGELIERSRYGRERVRQIRDGLDRAGRRTTEESQ